MEGQAKAPGESGKDPFGFDHFRKRGHGLSLGPHADELARALLHHDRDGALATLTEAADSGWSLAQIEEEVIGPAVAKLGELWLRRRLDDATFTRSGALAERVEWTFRHSLVAHQRPKAEEPI